MQKTNEFSEQPKFFYTATDELREKQDFSESLETDKLERVQSLHHWLFRGLVQISDSFITFSLHHLF